MKNNQDFSNFSVRKASGEVAPFDETKLRRSLRHSGANDHLVNMVLQEIRGQVYDNMPTKALYKMAHKLLKRLDRPVADRYSLKQAVMELGPSGYPFERFFAEIFKSQGFSVKTGQLLPGKCITHEMDVVAETTTDLVFVECKYHPLQGSVSDVKVPLYLHARFLDLAANPEIQREKGERNLQFVIATNTRFSDDAMTYGRCAGLHLVAWNYPVGNGLRDMIDKSGLHPVTCIGSLTRQEKAALLNKGMVLCRQLFEHPKMLGEIGVSLGREKAILKELEGLCSVK
jgi:hypothetical protein